jgi:hypothetical protein
MAGQIQERELLAPLSEAIADTTINNIKAEILIAVFMGSPYGKKTGASARTAPADSPNF